MREPRDPVGGRAFHALDLFELLEQGLDLVFHLACNDLMQRAVGRNPGTACTRGKLRAADLLPGPQKAALNQGIATHVGTWQCGFPNVLSRDAPASGGNAQD